MDLIHLEIVTPEKFVTKENVANVVAMGVEGEFGVLPGHTPFMTELKIGALSYDDPQGSTHLVFINKGFAEVLPSKVTVLAESAEKKEDIDMSRAEKAKKRAEQRIADAKAGTRTTEEIDLYRAEASLERALIRLALGHM